MARLCPFRQFVDASGLPLASGLIHTYVTGTTTPKATYTDASGDTPLPNPVVLSTAGTKEIWMDVDAAYTFVIADSNNNTLNTIDNLLPVTNLALASGSANIDMSGYSILTTSGNLTLAPVAGSHVSISGYTMPSGLPSVGQVPVASSSTALDWGSATSVAAASDMTAATSTTLMVTPGRIKYSPNTVVATALFSTASSGTAAMTLASSRNITSVTRVSALVYDVVFSTLTASPTAVHVTGAHSTAATIVTGSMSLNVAATTSTCRIVLSHEGAGTVFGMITILGTLA